MRFRLVKGKRLLPLSLKWTGPGNLFVISVDSVNDEIITGNNNETVWLPEIPECPVECVPDTIEILTTLYEFDTLFVAMYDTIIEYIELPQDTIVMLEVDTLIEYVELPPDTVMIVELDTVYWEYYFYDTVYVDVIDTIYINVLDTVVITETDVQYVYITDTLEVPVTDTLYITDVDTLMQEVLVYEYIYSTDTIYDVVYNDVLVDCSTGLPCENGFTGTDCRSVFVPNAFSPNNDGINDTFYAASESYDCWLEWQLIVYNRWGDVVWSSTDPNIQWYGQIVNEWQAMVYIFGP
jgi:gliding motility-associated-like protein